MVNNISTTTTIAIHSGMVNMVNTDMGISMNGAFRWKKKNGTNDQGNPMGGTQWLDGNGKSY